jgi:hypothetical protein
MEVQSTRAETSKFLPGQATSAVMFASPAGSAKLLKVGTSNFRLQRLKLAAGKRVSLPVA